MTAIVYLIPFLACLLLAVVFDYQGKWTVYLWIVLGGEAFVGLLHLLFYKLQTTSTEYLGSLVKAVHHEHEWIELVPRTVTRRDSRGNTVTSVQIVEQRHPEQYYFDTTRGTRINTNGWFFRYVLDRWGLAPVPVSWTDRRIKGGVRYGSRQVMTFYDDNSWQDDGRWVSVTEKNLYKNKIKKSNSIFKFRKISKKEAEKLGLFKYPKLVNHDAPCIMTQSVDVTLAQQDKFRRFNGAFAPRRQMRLYVLIFNADKTTAAFAQFQREYWQGGNKNEFVVCLGVNGEKSVEWAHTFSWADVQQLEAETTQWFLRNPQLDLDAFYDWLRMHYHQWERKKFSDFKYISVPLPGWQLLTIMGASILENVVVIWQILAK